VSAIHSRSHIKPLASATRKLIVRAGLPFSADGGEVCHLRRNLTPPVREFMDVTVKHTSLETMDSTDRPVCTLAEYFSAWNNSRQSLLPAGRFTSSPSVPPGDDVNQSKEEDFGRTVAMGANRSGAAGGGNPGGCPRPSGAGEREWNGNLVRALAKKCKANFLGV
jgi:hypothetical protein